MIFLDVHDDGAGISFSSIVRTAVKRKIITLEKVTQIFFSGKRKMINKAFAKLFKNYKEIAGLLNIDLKKRPSELLFDDYYKITERYENNLS